MNFKITTLTLLATTGMAGAAAAQTSFEYWYGLSGDLGNVV
jgi:hypothetical protein